MNKKKLLLGIGTIATFSATAVFAVSCSDEKIDAAAEKLSNAKLRLSNLNKITAEIQIEYKVTITLIGVYAHPDKFGVSVHIYKISRGNKSKKVKVEVAGIM
ncbi:Uncharacterised protein [Mycoplasmopsis californica]|nr:Uncharacterised protein [Mycoplasmopsis californica]